MSTKTTAYGSITIVDITDIGEFSVQPESNMPLSVIYDPNQDTYTPNWTMNNLKLTPIVYYAGKQLDLTTSGVKVEWTRKDGAGAEGSLVSDGYENVQNNVLTVMSRSAIYPKCSSGLLTYICTATYIEPESQTTLTAKGQITFSLVKHASEVKTCTITGENVFKYDTSGVLINGTEDKSYGGFYHTLTANVNNTTIKKWTYKNSYGGWSDYPTGLSNETNTGTTINVYANVIEPHNVFVNDVATIRVETTDASVYDIHTITRLRDGAAGSSTIAAVLSNDDQWIACNSKGEPLNGAFEHAFSTITIFEGGQDVTKDWTITCTPDGAEGTYNADTYTYTVTGISQVSANIEFKCEKENYTPIYKIFSLTKHSAAKDGTSPTIYSVEPDTYIVNRTVDGIYTPSSVTFSAYSKTGNEDKASYAGRFKIYVDGADTPTYSSMSDEEMYTYNITGTGLKSVRCQLYKAGGAGDPIDTQTIVVTNDGATGADGAQGEKGEAATNVVLGNQADIIPCNNDGTVKSAMTLTIPFTGYLGTSKVACTVTVSGLPSGMSVKTNTAGTAFANGNLELLVDANSKLGDTNTGTVTLTFTCNGTTILHYYQWSKATDGENAVLFQIYAPSGNIITNGENDVKLEAHLVDGASEVTDKATYVWKKYQDGSYTTISGQTNSSLIVGADSVSGYASYQCTATYNKKTYVAYYAVYDKNDPVQAHIYSSVGTQILNGTGYGAIYTKIFRNGVEIDPIKSERFLTEAPSDGEFYYHLDTFAKTVTLKKYNGTSWVDATGDDLPQATYSYTFRDKDGNITEYNNSSIVTNKVFYIDGSFITKKIIIDVAVEV